MEGRNRCICFYRKLLQTKSGYIVKSRANRKRTDMFHVPDVDEVKNM